MGLTDGHGAPGGGAGEGDGVLLATIRDFADGGGALRVTVLLDRGEGHAAPRIEAEPRGFLSIEMGGERLEVAPVELLGVAGLPVEPPPAVPASALDVDVAAGQVSAPIGTLEALASAVRRLASALGGRTVALAEFATRSGEPLAIAARPGEPAVLAIGEHEFELPEA